MYRVGDVVELNFKKTTLNLDQSIEFKIRFGKMENSKFDYSKDILTFTILIKYKEKKVMIYLLDVFLSSIKIFVIMSSHQKNRKILGDSLD